uniref:dephospho-CoA kinase n=1 Tax=Flavobacterium sp. TaxID=239 RepID=UPI0035B0E822
TILVTAPLEDRIKRVMERDLKTREEVFQVIKNQMTDKEKSSLATFVIENNEIEKMHKQVKIILQKLKNL